MSLTINISPIILKIGIIQITYYSLVYILGFLALLYILIKASKKKGISLSKNQVYDFIIFLFISVLIGARIFHILFWDFEYFSHHIKEIFYIWQGGLSFHGGLLGGIIFSYVYCKKHNLSFLKPQDLHLRNLPTSVRETSRCLRHLESTQESLILDEANSNLDGAQEPENTPRTSVQGFLTLADIVILPATLFLALGRIANLINSEILGRVTNSSWCIYLQSIEGCRYPIQIYSTIGRLALFFILLKISSKKHKDGFIFFIFLFLISLGRFFLDFLREDIRYSYLTAGQWLSLILLIVSYYVLLKDYFRLKF